MGVGFVGEAGSSGRSRRHDMAQRDEIDKRARHIVERRKTKAQEPDVMLLVTAIREALLQGRTIPGAVVEAGITGRSVWCPVCGGWDFGAGDDVPAFGRRCRTCGGAGRVGGGA